MLTSSRNQPCNNKLRIITNSSSAATTSADKHRLCACRDHGATVTSDEYTKSVVYASSGKFVFS